MHLTPGHVNRWCNENVNNDLISSDVDTSAESCSYMHL